MENILKPHLNSCDYCYRDLEKPLNKCKDKEDCLSVQNGKFGFSWAMQDKEGKIYYCCNQFFGIQDKEGNQLISCYVLEDETIFNNCYEIAQQLYAIKEGWAYA